jgi:hypothetical protein
MPRRLAASPPPHQAYRNRHSPTSGTRKKATALSKVSEEIGITIRAAIQQWPQTLRLISILAAATIPIALAVILRH